jgi:hypothetical protein
MLKALLRTVAPLATATLLTTTLDAQEKTSKGDVARPPTFSSMIAAINFTPATVGTLAARKTIAAGDVRLVDARSLEQGQSDAILNVVLQRHAAGIEQLRSLLRAQTEVVALLGNHSPKVNVSEVIAVEVLSDDKLLLYWKPKGT